MIDTIAKLERNRDETLPFFSLDAVVMSRSYAPGKWTARHILLHLVESEGVHLDRLRRTLAEAKPLLWAWDENRWAEGLFYDQRDLTIARDQFAADRAAIIELTRLAPPSIRERAAVHSEQGRRTFTQLIDTIHEHNAHHLRQLHAIATNQRWFPDPGSR
jgi:hypothetical protein